MATYYWVGGNGTWDASTTTNWSLSSGGAGGAGFPTTADSVIFNASSGAAPVVTISSAVCSACTIGAPTSGTLTLAFGTSSLTMSGNLSITTTISITGTGTIALSAVSPTFGGNGNTFYNLSFTSTAAGTITFTGANTFNNFTVATPVSLKTILFSANQIISGILTLGTTNGPITRIAVKSSAISTQRTLTCNSVATLSDVDFNDIKFAGACIGGGALTGTRLGNCGGNDVTTITFSAGINKYLYNLLGGGWNAAVWETSSVGVTPLLVNFPLAQDTIVIQNFGLNAGASSSPATFNFGSVNFSTRTLAMTLASGSTSPTFFGDFTLSSAVSLTGSGAFSFKGQGTQNITSAGKIFPVQIIMENGVGESKLIDNFQCSNTSVCLLNSGKLNLNNNTYTVFGFNSNNSVTRSIAFGTGSVNTTGSATVWNTSSTTGFSYTGTPTVNISNNSATATTVSTGSMTEAQSLNFNYTVGTYTLTDTNAVYKSVNFTGFTGTIPNSVRTIYGGATFVAGMTLTAGANATTFAATSGTNNITTAKTWDFPITVYGLGGTFAFQDALTMGSTRAFTLTAGTVQFKAGTTNTVGSFVATSGTTKYLQSTTPGTQAIISDASGVNSVNNLTIQDSFATGGATWDAFYGNGNIDGGNNTNWEFGESPVLGNEYEYKLRSMTERRRF